MEGCLEAPMPRGGGGAFIMYSLPMTLRILDIIEETTVDGPGFRNSVYCAGCHHHCPGCHNPDSWPMTAGREVEVCELARMLLSDPYSDVTFSGGDPFFQAEAFAELASLIKQQSHKTIWAYTGFTYEALIREANPARLRLLSLIDVLVDGPFIMAQRNEDLLFRGSSNQRLIDIKATQESGEVKLWKSDFVL